MFTQNAFDLCAKSFGVGSRNFVIYRASQKSYLWFPRLSTVTISTSLFKSTRDFLKLSFHMFPNNEILKVFKSKI